MKKLILGLFLLVCFANLDAQIIFSEDFDGIAGPTAGGAGTYSFPSGWLLRNVDNRTPAASVSYVNEAWERREDFANNVADSAAFSTSWYSPAGPADDWMWTPAISGIAATSVLRWNAVTYDPTYPDGYEVRIMTMSSTPSGPTGGTGVLGNQVTNSTQLFSIAAENNTWTTRSVNLAAFAGQTVWIAFRNTSNDKFILVIDDVIVENIVNYDASITAITPVSEYSKIPINQNPILPLKATISNLGVQNITNVTLNANVYDESNNLVFTSSSTALPSMATGANSLFTTNAPFIPATNSNYRIDYSFNMTETDQNLANNMRSDSIAITDTVYARDLGAVTGALGIGAGNGGNLGNQYVLTDTARLSSVSVYFANQVAGSKIGLDIFNYENGLPTTILYSSPVDSITSLLSDWHQFLIPGNLILLPDTYLVAVREIDSTLSVGQTTNKFFNNTIWVNWPTSPSGGWANVEDFGTSFSKPFIIRPNLLDKCSGYHLNVTTSENPSICFGTNDTIVATGGTTYLWDGIAGDDSLIFTASTTHTYTVIAMNPYNCIDTTTITITVLDLPIVSITGNNEVCMGNSTSLTGGGAQSYTWTGGIMDGVTFTPTATQTYIVTGTDNNGCIDTALVEVIVNPLPVVSITGNDTVCMGTSTSLNGGGAQNYSWTGGITDGIAFTPSTTQTYIVTGTDSHGCIDTASIHITVFDLPIVTINSSAGDTLCSGASTILTGDGALSYTWTNGVTDAVSFIPSASQTYIVTGTDLHGCIDTASIVVTVETCQSINSNETNLGISVYPNPSTGQFFITLNENTVVKVYNALGEVIMNETLLMGQHIINLTKYETGVYFIKATANNKQQIIKLINNN